MGVCYPINQIMVTKQTFDASGTEIDSGTSPWFVFPDEVEERMAIILKPYGYQSDSDGLPDAEHFLGQIEYMCCDEYGRYPWAIILYHAEYPLGQHLLSIRPNRDIRFSNYSLCHPHNIRPHDSEIDKLPPLSIVFVFSKSSLIGAVEMNSPLLKDAWNFLADKSESDTWLVIADPLDPAWVRRTAMEGNVRERH